MSIHVVPGTANPSLAGEVANRLDTTLAEHRMTRFPDGELRPAVGHMRDGDVYVIQPTGPPVNEHLVELLLTLDACRRAGAGRVTAVVPYYGYGRQDRRAAAGEAVGAKVVADAMVAAGAHRLLVVDPHTASLEAMSAVPVEMLTAVPVLAAAVASTLGGREPVIVAPDLGAVKLAERYSEILGGSVAVVRKVRVSGDRVEARDVVGEVDGRPAVLVDDMISTGGTIRAALRALGERGVAPGTVVSATHGIFAVPGAAERIVEAGAGRVFVTDTLPTVGDDLVVCSVARLLAEAIGRIHDGGPLDGLLLDV